MADLIRLNRTREFRPRFERSNKFTGTRIESFAVEGIRHFIEEGAEAAFCGLKITRVDSDEVVKTTCMECGEIFCQRKSPDPEEAKVDTAELTEQISEITSEVLNGA